MELALNRLTKEYAKIRSGNELTENITIEPSDNMFYWTGKIIGPPDSPYEGGIFLVHVDIPKDYPFNPPVITMDTEIFHPNINRYGYICLDILGLKWTPILTIAKLLLSVSSLLDDPNPEDPMNEEAALYVIIFILLILTLQIHILAHFQSCFHDT